MSFMKTAFWIGSFIKPPWRQSCLLLRRRLLHHHQHHQQRRRKIIMLLVVVAVVEIVQAVVVVVIIICTAPHVPVVVPILPIWSSIAWKRELRGKRITPLIHNVLAFGEWIFTNYYKFIIISWRFTMFSLLDRHHHNKLDYYAHAKNGGQAVKKQPQKQTDSV